MSADFDVLSAFMILFLALILSFMVSVNVSTYTNLFLNEIDEQSAALHVIEQLCLHPGVPISWENNVSSVELVGLALPNCSSPYTLSPIKVRALPRLSSSNLLRLLGVSGSRFKVQISLEPLFRDSSDLAFKLGDANLREAFTASRVVSISGELFVLRVSVERVRSG